MNGTNGSQQDMYPYVRVTVSLTVYRTSSSSYTGALARAPKEPLKVDK